MRTVLMILAVSAAVLVHAPTGPVAQATLAAAPPAPAPAAPAPAPAAQPKNEAAPAPPSEPKSAPAPAPAAPAAAPAPSPEQKGGAAPAAPAPAAAPAAPAPAAAPAAPVPAVEVKAPPRDEFRFQFDGIPYDDIIRRFAQMAGKPLLGEVRVEGSLTFFDSKPYTFDEALGLLNTILQMRGFTLIETARYIQVVPLTGPVSIMKNPAERIFPSPQAAEKVRGDEIVTVMVPLKFVLAEDAVKALQPMVSPFGSIVTAGRGRGVFLTDRMENIRRIKGVLDEIDTTTLAPPGERSLKTYVLKNASARDIATIITNIFGASGLGVGMGATAAASGYVPRYIRNPENGEWIRNPEWHGEGEGQRPPTPVSDASVKCTADERTNTLFVAGPPDKLAMAEELILKLDEIKPEQTGDMRIFELKNAKAEDVANTLRQILTGAQTRPSGYGEGMRYGEGWRSYEGSRYGPQPSQAQGMQARVVADSATNRIIVTAPLDQMNRIEELIKQLDQANIKYVGGIKVFLLKVADAQQLASVVANALRRAAPQEMTSRGMMPAAGAAQVSADSRTNSLIVAGSASDIQSAETLITELDRPLEGRDAREIHVVQLKAGDARQVATALVQLLRQQQEGGGGYGSGRYGAPVSSNVRVEAEPATNSLLISAAPGDWDTIKKILDQIETSVIPQTTATTRLIPLKFAKASSLAETLNQVYGQSSRARGGYSSYGGYGGYGRSASPGAAPQVPVVITADERSNMLIVSACEDDQKAIAEIVAKMDVQGAETADQVRIIRLKAGDAVKVAESLRGLYPQGGGFRGQPASQVFIQGDAASNSLLVRAADVEFKIIEKLAADLDTTITQTGGIRTFRLKVADAQQLATVLQGALAKRETMGRYGMSATPQTVVSADTRTNSIIVAGPAADIQTAETLIKELDKPLEEPAREIHVVQLKAGDARQMATALTNLLRQQDTPGRYGMSVAQATNIRVEAEAATNSLLISAAPGDWPTIQKILDQLKEAAGPLMVSSTRMITLKHAKASEVAETLRQIFSGGASSPYASGYGRSRTASYGASTAGGQQTVPVVIAASDANNSLLVSASEEDHKTIAELVKAMDVGSAEGVAGIRMIRLESADAVKLAETLKAMIPLPTRGQPPTISIQADPGSNTVLLRAPETDRKMFEEMISSLDKASTQGARETRMISLKFVSATTVAAMLSQLYQAPAVSTVSYGSYRRTGASSAAGESPDRVVIAAAPGDRAIVVDAPRDKMEEIARLVAGIDVPGGAGEQQVRTYRLVSAKATDLAPALSRLFTQQQTRMGRPTPSETEIQPRFEADPATNHVIVAATIAQFETIEKLIKELDSATSLARETRTFRLKFAKAADIVDVLQTMLSEAPAAPAGYRGFRGEAASAPAPAGDVRVAAMPETNDVVVQGPPDKIALAEQLIKTFDAQGAETQTVIQIVQLRNAQASTLAEAINATLAEKAAPGRRGDRGLRPGGGLGGAGPAAAEPERVTVTPEINSNSVLVRGPAADVPPVVEMIKKLDEGSTSGGAQVRVFPLQNSDPATLSASLGKLFQEMIRQQSGGGRGQQTIPFSIAADDRTQSLVVTTTPAYFALVEQILRQLDQTEGAPSQDVQYYSLENADATEVASQLTDMYKDRKGPEKPIITADAFSSAVTVIAKDADLKAIEQILSKLDKAAEATSFRVRVIPMTQVKAEKMAEVLKAVYSQMTGSGVNVTNEPSDVKPGAALGPVPVPEIAKPAPAAAPPAKSETRPGGPAPAAAEPKGKDRGGSSRERSRGAQGATGVEGETDAPGRAPAPVLLKAPVQKPGVTIGIDTSTNSLIISGKRQDLDYLEALINQLTPSSAQAEAEYRIFKIEKADPTAVARTLDSLFNPRPTLQQLQVQMQGGGGGGRGGQQGGGAPVTLPPPSIIAVADVRTSSLIIRAKPLDFELIEPLVKHLDQIPTVASEIRIFTLKNTDATEVAANLRDLFGLNQRQQGQMPQPQPQQQGQGGRPSPQDQRAAMIRQMMELANKGGTTQIDVTAMMSVTANRQTNSVVVAAPTDVMGIVERVIQELDQSGVPGVASVRMYPVKNADVRAMVTALQEIFVTGARQGGRGAAMGGGMGAAARPPALETPIVVTGDEAGRLVIVLAPADKHEVIAQVIKEIDDAQGMGEVTVRVYHLLNADATTVAPALASAMERGSAAGAAAVVGGRGPPGRAGGGGGAPGQIRISADRSSNCLVVRATAQDHEKIAQLITEMDTGTEAVVRMYPLKNADVRTTVQALQEIFGAGARVGAAAGGGRRGAAGAAGAAGERGTIVVTGDEAGRLVIVSAPAEKQDLVAQVIKELDDASAAGDVTIKVYRLENADATTMATALQGTLDRTAAAGGGGRGGAAAAAAAGGATRISADRGSNSLVVRASATDHEKIAQLIKEMDVSPTEQFAVRLIPLNNADAVNMAQVLTRVFAATGAAAPAGARGPRGTVGATAAAVRSPVVIEADRDARMLMVRADDPTFEKIKALAQQLDTASHGGEMVPTVLPLKFAQAAAVAPVLSQAFSGPVRPGGMAAGRGAAATTGLNPDDMVTILAEPTTNSLIVTANPKNLEKVQTLLAKLDTEVAGGLRTELIILKNARAADVAPVLQRMAQPGPTGGMGARGAAGAAALGVAAVVVSADAGSNSLVISGPSAEIDKVLKMAHDLDQATGEPLVKMYPLKNADVKATVTALQELFGSTGGAGAAAGIRRMFGAPAAQAAGTVVVTGDELGRQVIVSAPAEKHELVAKVIKEMDDAAGGDQLAVKIYRLQNADATSVAAALQATVERVPGTTAGLGARGAAGAAGLVRVSADRSSNCLVVRASAEDHVRIAQLVTELDVAPTEQYAVRLIPLNTADATNVASVLTRIFTGAAATGGTGAASRLGPGGPRPPVIIEADRDARMLMVRADDPTFEKIKALAEKMDEASKGQAMPTVIALKYAQAAVVAPTLQSAFAARVAGATGRAGAPANPDEQVTVVAEPASNSLVVTANTMNLEKVNAILAKLDTQVAGGIRTELVILKNAKAADVAPVLTRMVQTVAAGPKGAAAAAVTISAETGSNGLVISGPSAEVDKVKKMVADIDDASSGTLSSVYVVALRNGDANTVAQMVRDLYAQQQQAATRDKKSIDPLAVTSDLRSNAIVLATTKQMYEQVTQWVNQIETMQPSRGAVRIITLQNADPAELDKAIKQIFPAGTPGTTTIPVRRGPGGPQGVSGPAGAAASPSGGKVDTTVLPGQKSVLVNASDEDFETIRKLAEALDAAAAEARRQVQVIPLKNASNTRVALALMNLYRAAAMRPGVAAPAPEEQVTVVALPDTNAVVVTASRVKMDEVTHLISELDKVEIAPQLEFRIYPLKNAQPTKIMPLLTQMLMQVRQLRPEEPINVQADERTRSVIVTARGPMFDQIGKIVETLDTEPAHAAVEVLILPLKKADATRLAAVLTEMLRPSATGQVTPEALALQEQIRLLRVRGPDADKAPPELDLTKPIKVSADPNAAGAGGAAAAGGAQGSNSLIITSTPENLKAMKAIVEILDVVPLAEGTRVRVVHLLNADASSVMTVLKDIFTQGRTLAGKPRSSVEGRAEPESTSGKALVNPLNVSADERTNTLVLSGLEESLALADLVIKDLDRDAGKIVTEVRLFRLKFADVTRLLPILQAVFAEGTAAGGAAAVAQATVGGVEGIRTQVTRLKTVLDKQAGHISEIPKTRAALAIQGDPTTSIVIVAARSDVMPLIADVIQTMDVPGAGAMNTVRIYPLVNADATRLKAVVDGLYTGPNAQLVRIEDRPTVQVDVRTNALVVCASDKTFAMVETLLKTLDAKQPIELRDIRLVPLKNADAAALAPVLQAMMDARVQRVQALGVADAEALRVIISADSRSNSLMVGGSAEGFDLVKSLAEQLDAAGPAIIGQVQLMPLKFANAGTLATTLTNLFTQRYAQARTPDIARQKPIVLPDVRVNALLVAANADDTKVIQGLLVKMDVQLDPTVQLVLMPLAFNDAGIVGPEIQRLFTARLTSMTPAGQPPNPQDRVDIGTDALSNSLIVSASKENVELIKGLLEKVDVEPPVETGIVRMYALQNSDATRIATMLQGLISQGLYKPGVAVAAGSPLLAAREKVAITADVRTNVLIVSASRENFAVIEEIIKKIDSTDDFGLLGDIRLFILKNANATRLAPTLQQLFTAKRTAEQAAGGTGRMLPVSVFADARTNALLVTGSKESFNAVEAMVRELDTDQVLAANEFKVFYLRQATAQVLAPTLQQLFAQRVSRGVPLDPVTVVIEQRTNSLIVAASPEDMKLAESLIARLDAEPDRPGTTVQVFPLVKADATQVSTTINNLYRAGPGAAGVAAAGGPQVIVSVDERINALIVSAGPADQKRISELVHQLDADSVPRVTEIRVFTLQNADATEMAQILTAALNNKPVPLTATSPNRQTLLQFITQTKEGGKLVSSALQEGVLITADRRTNSLVVSAPQENMSLLESLITAMDSTTPRMAEIRVFQLQNADARQMSTVLLQLFRMQTAAGAPAVAQATKQAIQYTLKTPPEPDKGPSATLGSAEEIALTVTVDIRTNSLLVGGTKRYVDLASKVIEELEASAAEERLTEIYRLRNAQAADIQTAVSSFLTQERTLLQQSLGVAQGASNFILDREVAIVAEPTTNTLLLSASPRYFDVIAQLIAELDQPPPQVLVQVLLAEVSIGDSTDFGIDWNFTHTWGKNKLNTGTNFGVSANLTPGFGVSVTGGDLSYFLRALQAQNRLEVLSRPQILASDNQRATINIGQRVPFITNSRVTENGTTLNTVQYQQIGIILNVIARINPDGFVKLTVAPEISSLSDAEVQISPGVRAIIINSRSAETTVTVQDGHTIVIGGLITTKDSNIEDKVPILGDIPILGWLFKSTSITKERSELLIILTPTVIRNVPDADSSTQAQVKRLNLLRESKHDLMQKSLFKPLDGGPPQGGQAAGAEGDSAAKELLNEAGKEPPKTPAKAPVLVPLSPGGSPRRPPEPAAGAAGVNGPKEGAK